MKITKSGDPENFDAALQNFNVGMRVQLRAQRNTGLIEHFSSLIGFVKDEFLMVKLPMVQNMPIMFHDDEPVIVRAFTGTRIYSFSTTVMRTFLGPLYYMHLCYPREINSSTLRSDLRIRIRIAAKVEYTDPTGAEVSSEVTLANLSMSGAAIGIETSLNVGQQVHLSFAVNSDSVERVIRTQAIVRSVNRKPSEAGGKSILFSCGMQFQNLDVDDQMALRLRRTKRSCQIDKTSFDVCQVAGRTCW